MRPIFLGFDFGTRRIGIATGQHITATAQPLTTIAAKQGKPDWPTLDRIVAQWDPEGFVVGLPLHADGGEHRLSRAARAFGRSLQRRYRLPLHFVDERLSSLEAERHLAERGARHDPGAIDSEAASLILRSWLQA